MNWGNVGAWTGAVLSLVSAVGYFLAGDTRRALYFLFAFLITATVIWR